MNNDLISRSELKKVIETYRSNECFNDFQRGKNKMIDCCLAEIDNAPTVDKGYDFGYADGHGEGYELGKNSRPQGEWILKETDCDDGGNNRYECSKCHYSDVHASSAEVPFCWHCGAEMKGGAE